MGRRRRPKDPAALLLWPGAGTDAAHHSLVDIEQRVPELPVRRIDFPYRRPRAGETIPKRRPPDRAEKLVSSIREDVAKTADELGVPVERLVIGGRSMGGRMCSIAVAEGLPVAGVVLIAYPLHPPGRPERLRTEHLGDVLVPSLWLCGDRDPFGTPEELADALRSVPGPITTATLPGGHDLARSQDLVVRELRDWLGLARRPTR